MLFYTMEKIPITGVARFNTHTVKMNIVRHLLGTEYAHRSPWPTKINIFKDNVLIRTNKLNCLNTAWEENLGCHLSLFLQ